MELSKEREDEFSVFLIGLRHSIKKRNLLMGRQIKPRAEWDILSNAEQDRLVMEALIRLPNNEMALLMHTAHEAINKTLKMRGKE